MDITNRVRGDELKKIPLFLALTTILISTAASAVWTVYEYRNEKGEYKYGVKQGKDQIKLGLKSRNKAQKTANKMNDANKADKEAAK